MKYIIQKQGKGWPLHIVLDDDTREKLMVNGNKRAIGTEKMTGTSFHCAINLNKNIGYFVYVNAPLGKALKLTEGDSIDLSFEIDTTEYQFEMPEELLEVLNQDPEANEIFQRLTAGKKRALIFMITQIKSIDKRIEKSIKIIGKLKLGITDLKVLNS